MQEYSNQRNNAEWVGAITLNDFNTENPNIKKIKREREAEIFNKKMKEQNKQETDYLKMTWKELEELRVVSSSTGRPSDSMTDEKWQLEFKIRKHFIEPYNFKSKRLYRINCPITWDKNITNWQNYCWYINDVLKNIEAGGHDYCYYLYQVIELLKFYPDNLKTKYCKFNDNEDEGGYWEVWLKSKP